MKRKDINQMWKLELARLFELVGHPPDSLGVWYSWSLEVAKHLDQLKDIVTQIPDEIATVIKAQEEKTLAEVVLLPESPKLDLWKGVI